MKEADPDEFSPVQQGMGFKVGDYVVINSMAGGYWVDEYNLQGRVGIIIRIVPSLSRIDVHLTEPPIGWIHRFITIHSSDDLELAPPMDPSEVDKIRESLLKRYKEL